MKINFSFLVLFLCTLFYTLSAQKVDTIRILSPSMKKEIKNVIILPQDYEKNKKQSYPVVYLLHGHGGRYDSWIKETQPRLPELATEWGMIFVCPDGSNSWYWDSPVDSSSRYETYISQELTDYIDKNYRSIASPKGRAITGYSMGGHGALWLAFRHPDLYGAAGSMSGGVDIRPFPHSWHMKDYLGSYEKNPEIWEQHTVINQLPYKAPTGQLALIIDCGSSDFFYEVNQRLHEKLLYYRIPHDYIIRPGSHTFSYWKNAIDYQLLYFNKYFKSL